MSIPSDLRERALALPVAERAELANELPLSLEADEGERDPDWAESWSVELERRMQRIESGEAILIDADVAPERLRGASPRRRGS